MIPHLLTELLFLTAMAQLGLCLYQHISGTAKKTRLWNGAVFAALLLLCSYTAAVSDGPDATVTLPWAGLLALSVLVLCHVVRGLRRTYRESRETLTLKMKIHNDIGTSLIALTEQLDRGSLEDVDAQLKKLGFAVGVFVDYHPEPPAALEEVRRQAEELRIKLVIDGPVPIQRTAQGLVVAAIRECITNCARHARGSEVAVSITLRGGFYIVTITNDGRPPDGPIVEGGGLSSLRKRVERAGGEMRLTHAPRFALLLHLPEKEAE